MRLLNSIGKNTLVASAVVLLGCSSSTSADPPPKPITGTLYGNPFTAKMAMARYTLNQPPGAPRTQTIEIFKDAAQLCSTYESRYAKGYELTLTIEARDGATTDRVDMIDHSGPAGGATTLPTDKAHAVLVKAATVPSKGMPNVEGSTGHIRVEATGNETDVSGEIDYELCN